MNCPRCKSGAASFPTHFACLNCSAAFVEDEASVEMQPLVEDPASRGVYSVRLAARVEAKSILAILLLALMSAVLVHEALTETKTSELVSAAILLVVLVPLLVLSIRETLRAKYGRVKIDANREELVVTETFFGLQPPWRIPRASINGFWVAGAVDDSGQPLPSYSVMLDRNDLAKVRVVAVQLVQPAIALAEDLARRMRVPTDTRGSHFR